MSFWLLGHGSLLHGIGGVGLFALTCLWFKLFLILCDQILAATLLPYYKVDTSPLPVFLSSGPLLQHLVVHLLSGILFGGCWLVFVGLLLMLMDVVQWNTGLDLSKACQFAQLSFCMVLHCLPKWRQCMNGLLFVLMLRFDTFAEWMFDASQRDSNLAVTVFILLQSLHSRHHSICFQRHF